jgi:hypothetical protein
VRVGVGPSVSTEWVKEKGVLNVPRFVGAKIVEAVSTGDAD